VESKEEQVFFILFIGFLKQRLQKVTAGRRIELAFGAALHQRGRVHPLARFLAGRAFGLAMTTFEQSSVQPAERDGWFQTTHWSVVLSAGHPESAQAQAAFAKLCQTYWYYPLYVFVRRQGQSAEDAKDLVQGFVAKAIEKNFVAAAEPAKVAFVPFCCLVSNVTWPTNGTTPTGRNGAAENR
jgi:hypothetical protein